MTRIDAHHHLWRYSPAEFGWIGEAMASLRQDFLVQDLAAEMQVAGVQGTVAVQARQTLAETEWLLETAEASPAIYGVVGWLPLASPNLRALCERFQSRRSLKGLRHVVQSEPKGFLDGAMFNQGVRALRDFGLTYDVLIFAHQLPEAIRFVDRHPQQSFVLDHIAKPAIRAGEIEQWAADLRELARRPHVTCKVSGMVTEADWMCWSADTLKPYFDVVLESFGASRLMIGTDWPVLTVGCSYAAWWRIVEEWIGPLSEAEQQQVLGGTALRVYHLDLPPQQASGRSQAQELSR